MNRKGSVEHRLFGNAQEDENGCWVWQRPLSNKGYGRIEIAGKTYTAHRVAYEFMVHEIPEGLTLDHLCRNKACINPYHLDPVPNAVNQRRSAELVTHCLNGHLYTAENTKRNSRGHRNCRACHSSGYADGRYNYRV